MPTFTHIRNTIKPKGKIVYEYNPLYNYRPTALEKKKAEDLYEEYKEYRKDYKPGEEYEASKINDNWWLIDTVGVSKEDFNKCFDKIEKLDK